MQSGELTVTGKNSTRILLHGYPHRVEVRFVSVTPIPCNPHHHDTLHYDVAIVDEDPRRHHDIPHIHHDRQFYLVIYWQVSGVREIKWFADC